MRILYISKLAPYLGVPHVHEVAKRFVARGHEVTVLSAATERRQPGVAVVDGVEIVAVWTAPRALRTPGRLGFFATRLPFYLRVPGLVARRYSDVDVIIEDVAPLRAPRLPAMARRRGIPLLYQTHNAYPDRASWTATYGIKGVLGWLADRAFRRTPRCDALFADARYTADSYAGIGCPVRWIPNGVDTGVFRPPRGERSDNEPLGVLSVGRATRSKNQQVLIRALARARRQDILLTIVGEGPDRPRLETLATELGVAARVRFTRFLDRERLVREYQRADLFVLPSLWEGLPHVVLEALGSGLPVAMSDIPAAEGLIEPEFGWTLPSQDVDAWAALLDEASEDRDGLVAMGRLARKTTLEWFDWDQVTDDIGELVTEVRAGTASESSDEPTFLEGPDPVARDLRSRAGRSRAGTDVQPRPAGASLTFALLAVVALAVVVGRVAIVAEARALAAATLAVALPAALGSTLRRSRCWGIGPELALRFGLGNVVIVAVALVADALGAFSVDLLGVVVLAALVLTAVPCWRQIRTNRISRGVAPGWWRRHHALAVALAAAGATAAAAYWRSRSPLPYQPLWDGLLHLGIIERMMVEGRFSLSLRSLSPAFAFDPYLPGFHLNLGLASRLTGVPVLNELWAGTFVLSALAGAGIFELTRRTWSSTPAALGAAVVSGLFMTGHKSTNPLLHILPASEVMALAPLALLVLDDGDRRRRLARGTAVSLALCTVHVLMGALLLGVIIGSELVTAVLRAAGTRHLTPEPAAAQAHPTRGAIMRARRRARTLRRRHVATVRVVATTTATVAVLFGFAYYLRRILPRVAIDPTSFYGSLTPSVDLRSRVALVNGSLPKGLPGLLVVVAVVALWRSPRARILPAVPVVVLVGFAVPIVGLERLEGFLFIAVAVTLGALLCGLESLLQQVRARALLAPSWRAVAVAVTPMLAVPLLVQPLSKFRAYQRRDTAQPNLQSSFAPYELEAMPVFADWSGRAQVIVSDPMTQQLAEGFGRLDSVGGTGMPARLHVQILDTIEAPTAVLARQRLAALQARFGRFTLIVSGRTEHWAVVNGRRLRAKRKKAKITPEQLRFLPSFRAWDFSALPDRFITKRTKDDLLAPLRASGCVVRQNDRGEIVAFQIDCRERKSENAGTRSAAPQRALELREVRSHH